MRIYQKNEIEKYDKNLPLHKLEVDLWEEHI